MESSAPARVLVVAHRTAATPALQKAVAERAAAGPAVFTLLVPTRAARPAPRRRPRGHRPRRGAARCSSSRCRCSRRPPASHIEGIIGDHNPFDAVSDAVNIARLRRDHHLDAAGARVALAAQRPAEQAQRARPAGHDGDGARARARSPSARGARLRRGEPRPARPQPRPSASRSACVVDQNASSSHGSSAGANARTSVASSVSRGNAERAGVEDDEHDAILGARVDADERAELDLDLELLARLAPRGVLDGLAELDEAAGERPATRALVQRAAQQPDPPVARRAGSPRRPARGSTAPGSRRPRSVSERGNVTTPRPRSAGRSARPRAPG